MLNTNTKADLLVNLVISISNATGIENTPRSVVEYARELVEEIERVIDVYVSDAGPLIPLDRISNQNLN